MRLWSERHRIPQLWLLIALAFSLACLLPLEMLGLGLCPPKDCSVWTSCIWKCDLIWKKDRRRYSSSDEVIRMSPNSFWLHLYQKGNLGKDRHTHAGRSHMKLKGELRVIHLKQKGTPVTYRKEIQPFTDFRINQTLHPNLRCPDANFLMPKLHSLWNFVIATQAH